jgi:hypothetical protein
VVVCFVGEEDGFVILRGVEDAQDFNSILTDLIIHDIIPMRHSANTGALMPGDESETRWERSETHTSFQQLFNKRDSSGLIELLYVIADALEVVFRLIGDYDVHARRSYRVA